MQKTGNELRRVLVRTLIRLAMVVLVVSAVRVVEAEESPAAKMAATVIRQWPAGMVLTENKPGEWAYEEGVLLDGMAAQWHANADGRDFKYIKAAVDKYVTADGAIKGYPVDAHSLDNIEMGRAVVLLYRVTQEAKYYKAAKFIHEQLEVQPRTTSGGYWHKQIY